MLIFVSDCWLLVICCNWLCDVDWLMLIVAYFLFVVGCWLLVIVVGWCMAVDGC